MAIKHLKVSAKTDGADASLVQPSDWNASHIAPFRVVGAGETLVESDPIVAEITAQETFPLPASLDPGAQFIVRNSSASTAVAVIDPGAGRSIDYGPGRSLADGVALACAPGELLQLVARTSAVFEVVARQPPTLTASVTLSVGLYENSVTVSSPSMLPIMRVQAWLAPNADWDADDLADYRVIAIPDTGSLQFIVYGPGPVGGLFDIHYTWS